LKFFFEKKLIPPEIRDCLDLSNKNTPELRSFRRGKVFMG
jgi:hypothetical protein